MKRPHARSGYSAFPVLFALIAAISGAREARADSYDLGLALAIDYFGAEKGAPRELIGYGPNPSPEYRFMSGIAWGLASKAPALARLLTSSRGESLNPLTAPHLALEAAYSDPASIRALNELVIGCPYQEVLTQSVDQIDSKPEIQKSVKTFSLVTDSADEKAMVCMNSSVSKLNAMGFSLLQITSTPGSDESSVILATQAQPQNMLYVREKLKQVRALTALAPALLPIGGTGGIPAPRDGGVGKLTFGGAPATHVIGQAVSFTYEYSWGDCMSGCEYHHQWNVTAAPRASDANGNGAYTFDLTVQESGSPLLP